MKKIFLSLALVCAVVMARATGTLPINSPQSGSISFSGTNQIAVTAFAPGFSYPPVVSLLGSVTNIYPFTNVVTTTNFTLSIATNQISSGAGGTVYWTASSGFARIQAGTNSVLAATPTNVSFAVPYLATPSVAISDSVTNATVTSITTTGFTLTVNANEAVNWSAIGITATPGALTVTY